MMRELEHGGPHVHFIAFVFFNLSGIFLLHILFHFLILFLARTTRIRKDSWQSIFRFMPTLLGLIAGFQLTRNILQLPWFLRELLDKHFHSLVLVTVTFFAAHLCSSLLKAGLSRRESESSSMSILTTVIDLAVYMVGFVIILSSYGISISPLLTALGAGGLASALALQDTLSNLFSGITTILARQVHMGDYISLASGQAGRVVDMNWRNTTIRTNTGNMIIVPNKNIASSIITNYEQPQAECTIVIPLTITYENDLQHVEEVTLHVARSILDRSRYGVKGFTPQVRYDALGNYGIALNVVLRIRNVVDEPKIRHQFIKAIFDTYKTEKISLLIRHD
jgi:small-conductance mechanosensitive channel